MLPQTKISIQSHIISHVRFVIIALGFNKAGIDPDMVEAHSLRAGGAIAMKLNAGVDGETIMKHGRWTGGLMFMTFIHNQIAHLSEDRSQKMSKALPFLNSQHCKFLSQTEYKYRIHILYKHERQILMSDG